MMTSEQGIKIACDMLQNAIASCKAEEAAKAMAEIRAFMMQFVRPPIEPTAEEYVTGGTGVVNE